MIAFPSLLIEPARNAGIKVPEDFDDDKELDVEMFPHLYVFLAAQLGRRMPSPNSHWENAKVIASIPDDKIKTVTFDDLYKAGFE